MTTHNEPENDRAEDNLQTVLSEVKAAKAENNQRTFEDLTLAEVIGQFFRQPRQTYQSFVQITATPVNFPVSTSTPPVAALAEPQPAEAVAISEEAPPETLTEEEGDQTRLWVRLLGYVSAFVLAFVGCVILVSAETRFEAAQLQRGTPFLLAGFVIWLGTEFYTGSGVRLDEIRKTQFTPWSWINPIRIVAVLTSIVFAFVVWNQTAGNTFRALGFWAWVVSIITIVIALAPAHWTPGNIWRGLRDWWGGIEWRGNWTFMLLVMIMVVAAVFRFLDLNGIPPEMTSDHIEKLLDSQRVRQGDRDVFFINNGGREPFQMYAMALLSYIPGLGINFSTLKLLAVIEGLLTIPVLWWMGREVIGERNRRLGNIVGLTLAALVAVSYWHVAITRLSLRIVLTPLITALLVIFLGRGMRYNRLGDFVLAGLVLGFGLYTYQAVRMLPLVVLVGVGLAALWHWRDRRALLRYTTHLTVLVLVSFVVFVPMFRFSVDYPDAFWRRTAGRILGDNVVQYTDENGVIRERNATVDERLQAFQDNLPVLASNVRNALLMFNWKGDVAWINGVPNHPAMDSFTGALLIIGLGAWAALSVRARDPVYTLIPLMLLIMLLPSALSIAAPIENPSATRTSGALPPAYLIAALPLALVVLAVQRALGGNGGKLAAFGVAGVVVAGAFVINSDVYFNDYLRSYRGSWKTHSDPGQILENFVEEGNAYANAFLLHYPHWLDHRIVGAEAGILDWPNGIADQGGRTALERVPDYMHDQWYCPSSRYVLDPTSDLLFFVNQADEAAILQLLQWFPEGEETFMYRQDPKDQYRTYRVPALGQEGMQNWLERYTHSPRCPVQSEG